MDIYSKNIKLIKEHRPALWDILSNCGESYELVDCRAGGATIKVGDSFLHSRYDPVKEAKKAVADIEGKLVKTWIVCGVALGYHVVELSKRLERHNLILLLEPDPAVFKAALAVNDFSDLITDDRVYIFVKQDPDVVYDFLSFQIRRIMAADLSLLEWPASISLNEEYYQQTLLKIKDIIRLGHSNIRTVKFAGRKMTRNTILNIPKIINSTGVIKLVGLFKDYAGIIVSAGPSLNKNVHLLKEAKGKILIVSTDTALKVLLKEGIKPDFVVTSDYKAESALHFENQDTEGIPLIFDSEAATESLDVYRGPLFATNSIKPLSVWVNNLANEKGIVEKGMSVAHNIFKLLEIFYCKAIIFIGQDLSFPGGKSHASGTHSSVKIDEDKAYKEDLITIKSDIDGQELLTRNDMYIYKKHFELMVRNTAIKCVNATEGGAGIKGTEVMSLAEAIENYANKSGELDSLITRALELEEIYDRDVVRSKLDNFRGDFWQLNQAATKIELELSKLLADLDKGKTLDKSLVAKVVRQCEKDMKTVRSKELCLRIIHGDLMNELLQMHREGDGYDLSQLDEQDYIESLREDHNFQLAVKNSTEYVLEVIDQVITEI